MFYDCIRAVLKVLAFVLMPVRVYGRENLDREGAYILACNHQSYMDVPCLIIADKRRIRFMARSSFYRFRFVKWLFGKMGAFPVNVRTGDVDAMRNALKVLRAKEVLGIFPQGRRVKKSPYPKKEDMLGGVGCLAAKSATAIVPCVFERRPLILRINRLHIGKAIEVPDKGTISEKTEKINGMLFDAMISLFPEGPGISDKLKK